MRGPLISLGVLVLLVATAGSAEPTRQAMPPITLNDLSGQPFELGNLLGKVTVLNFWATWCGPCRLELPELQKLYNDVGGKGLVVLAVNVDLPPAVDEGALAQEIVASRPRIEAFMKAANVTLPVYLVDGKSQEMLDLEHIPFTVLLDGKGGVVRIYAGYSAGFMKDLRQQVLDTLAERSGQGGK